jgi:hypothetical protein
MKMKLSSLLLSLTALVVACNPTPATSDASPQADVEYEVDVANSDVAPSTRELPFTRKLPQVAPFTPALKDVRSQSQIATAACTAADGSWRCASKKPITFAAIGSTPITPISWTVTNWFIDPANLSTTASDSNDCITSTTACLTFGEVIVHRLGTHSPQWAQSVTINQISAQTLNVDNWYLNPVSVQGSNYAVIATNPNRGASFSPTTVTAKVQTSAGNALSLNGNLPAGLSVGDIVTNITKSSIAKVQAVAGGNATMTQPFASAGLTTISPFPFLTEDDTWANTDTYQATVPILSNMKTPLPLGGDATNPGGAIGTAWFQGLEIADSSGAPGGSVISAAPSGMSMMFSMCTMDPVFLLDNLRGEASEYLSCTGNVIEVLAGAMIQGGACTQLTALGSLANIDGDVIVKTTFNVFGVDVTIGDVQLLSTATMVLQPGAVAKTIAFTNTALLWGPGKLNLRASTFLNASGGTWANSLKLATLQIEGAATGSTPAAEGNFTLNGITQVDVAGVNGTNAFPANAAISWGLTTVGSTPGVSAPYFSAAQAANAFHVKSLTVSANDVYHWLAEQASGVTVSAANLDIYKEILNPQTGARYAFQ